MGRPKGSGEKLTQKISKQIVQGIRLGMPMKYAAQRAGVTYSSVFRWKREVAAGRNGIYKQFVEGLKRAEGAFIARNLKVIDTAAKEKTWQASAWLLERRSPENFSAHRAELKQLRDEISRLLKMMGDKPGGPASETTPRGEAHQSASGDNAVSGDERDKPVPE